MPRNGNHSKVQERWLLAKKLYTGVFCDEMPEMDDFMDSRLILEEIGFTSFIDGGGLFYSAVPPDGWTRSTEGQWTSFFDRMGNLKIQQVYEISHKDAYMDIT